MRLDQLENVNKEAIELNSLKSMLKAMETKDVHITCHRASGNGYWHENHRHEVLHPDEKQILADMLMRRVVSLTESLRQRGVAVCG